jgi:hypothetical protein
VHIVLLCGCDPSNFSCAWLLSAMCRPLAAPYETLGWQFQTVSNWQLDEAGTGYMPCATSTRKTAVTTIQTTSAPQSVPADTSAGLLVVANLCSWPVDWVRMGNVLGCKPDQVRSGTFAVATVVVYQRHSLLVLLHGVAVGGQSWPQRACWKQGYGSGSSQGEMISAAWSSQLSAALLLSTCGYRPALHVQLSY